MRRALESTRRSSRTHAAGRCPARLLLSSLLGLWAVVGLAAADALPGSLEPARSDLSEQDLARVRSVTRPAEDFSRPEPFEASQGGAATSRKRPDRNAFSQASANLSFAERGTFQLGNALFRKNWVSAPSSTQASDGLGPLFNGRACRAAI
jgi:di-heme oxidoreductase (putative peroxidase)